jgi:hypothetical protein
MNARFIDACLAEIDEAVTWYANQSPELPERILAELQGAVEKLTPFPDAFHMVADPGPWTSGEAFQSPKWRVWGNPSK